MTHRHTSDIEAEIDGLREYARQHPFMASYIEPKREELRRELRAARMAVFTPQVRPSFIRRFLSALLQP
jgi:hypothetical protein